MVTQLYPFRSNYFTHTAHRMHFIDEGTGEVIVMLHGNPTWSFYYRQLIAGLGKQYRCIAPDHIGCGFSDKPSATDYGYRLEDRVNDLDALLSLLVPNQKITLILHDWGGMIGMCYAKRHPERIARLVILNTASFHLPAGKKLPFSLRLGRNTRFGAWLIRHRNLFCRLAIKRAVKRQALQREVREMFLKPYDSPANRIAVLRFVQGIPLTANDPDYALVSDVEASLDRFQSVPMLICWGMQDFVFDGDFLKEWERRFPRAEVYRYEDVGHYILEDAGPEVLEKIQSFLKNHPIV